MRVATEMGSELDYGVIVGVGGCMEFCIDGVCSELECGNIPEMECGNIPEMERGNILEMDSEMGYGVVVGVGGRTEFCSDC